jgi:hypothetical protein
MAFRLHFRNGPRDGASETAASAPTSIPLEGGVYRIKTMTDRAVHYIWKAQDTLDQRLIDMGYDLEKLDTDNPYLGFLQEGR